MCVCVCVPIMSQAAAEILGDLHHPPPERCNPFVNKGEGTCSVDLGDDGNSATAGFALSTALFLFYSLLLFLSVLSSAIVSLSGWVGCTSGAL